MVIALIIVSAIVLAVILSSMVRTPDTIDTLDLEGWEKRELLAKLREMDKTKDVRQNIVRIELSSGKIVHIKYLGE